MIRMNHHHNKVHQDEVHCSARGHFIPQQFHRSGPVVRGEEGGVGEDALLLTLDQPHHHLDVQRRVILPREIYTLFVEKGSSSLQHKIPQSAGEMGSGCRNFLPICGYGMHLQVKLF